MVATFTTDLLNSAFHGFKYKGDFGLFKPKFIPKDLVAVNVIAVIPAVVLGIIGMDVQIENIVNLNSILFPWVYVQELKFSFPLILKLCLAHEVNIQD